MVYTGYVYKLFNKIIEPIFTKFAKNGSLIFIYGASDTVSTEISLMRSSRI